MEQFKPINEEENNQKGNNLENEVLRIENIKKGDEFTYESDTGTIIVRAQEIFSWAKPEINVKQVGGALGGRIFENVPLTKLTRVKEEKQNEWEIEKAAREQAKAEQVLTEKKERFAKIQVGDTVGYNETLDTEETTKTPAKFATVTEKNENNMTIGIDSAYEHITLDQIVDIAPKK